MLFLNPTLIPLSYQLIDYLSLRASRPDFLRDFIAGYGKAGGGAGIGEGGGGSERSLSLLPNFAYAQALGRLREQQQKCGGERAQAGSQQLPGSSSPPLSPGALELMLQAVLLHPRVVPRVLAQVWGN